MRAIVFAVVLSVAATNALAQTAQPYSGMQSRPIKSLSQSQVDDLRAGRGMGLALAGELNGYPGPLHVIELAERLSLSPEQRAQMEKLFTEMKSETIAIGERLIAEEHALDRLFAERSVTRESLDAATDAIGRTQGALRAAHLRYHLAAAAILSPAQTARYAELRGYTGGAQQHHGGQHRPRH